MDGEIDGCMDEEMDRWNARQKGRVKDRLL